MIDFYMKLARYQWKNTRAGRVVVIESEAESSMLLLFDDEGRYFGAIFKTRLDHLLEPVPEPEPLVEPPK